MSCYPFRYVPGCSVEYRPATDTCGSVWVAVIRRGRQRSDCYRATVPFNDGPDAAARAAVEKINEKEGFDWILLGAALSMDGGDRFTYPVGPTDLAPVLSMPAPARPEA